MADQISKSVLLTYESERFARMRIADKKEMFRKTASQHGIRAWKRPFFKAGVLILEAVVGVLVTATASRYTMRPIAFKKGRGM